MPSPDAYAVIGNPIAHSKSPQIHSAYAQAEGQDLTYTKIEAPLGGFAATVDRFRAEGGRGVNVTVPFKLDAFAYATDVSERARRAGAVNALKFEGAHVLAENFDGVGLVRDIETNLGVRLAGRRVLLLGAGGAARGAMMPLLLAKPLLLAVANRTPEKAADLARANASLGEVVGAGYADVPVGYYDVVINATSASLSGVAPGVDAKVFREAALAYDMMYGKGLTPFLKIAQGAGAHQLADGVGMLVEQAAEAFAWWRGMRPDTASVIKQLTVPLI